MQVVPLLTDLIPRRYLCVFIKRVESNLYLRFKKKNLKKVPCHEKVIRAYHRGMQIHPGARGTVFDYLSSRLLLHLDHFNISMMDLLLC